MPEIAFADRVLAWYDRHGRKDLPWQRPRTLYRVWVSEIMLQQTQVETVIPYFERFMQRFPDVRSLAQASLDELMQHWAGLGYYARARNLHRAAQVICTEHSGVFPDHIDAVLALPGIGRSTAGAILSLARNQRHAILDGNVKRVLARHRAIAGWPGQSAVAEQLWIAAEASTPTRRVADYNQAMMDLGATLCGRTPRCAACPVMTDCAARLLNQAKDFPGAKPRRPLPVRATAMPMLYTEFGAVLLERRPPWGIWGGLLSLPELAVDADLAGWSQEQFGVRILQQHTWPVLRHTFSHYHLDITPVALRVEDPGNRIMESARWVWYKEGPTPGGLAAPVKQLLRQLLEPKGRTDDANGTVREAG